MSVPVTDRRGVRRREDRHGALAVSASWFYRAGSGIVKGLYDSGVLPERHVRLPVVSVGALSVGGAGKTPFVRWLARGVAARGVPVAILSRGYGGSGGAAPRVVDPAAPDAARDGDEPVLLALSLPGIPVVVCPDRARSAALAEGRGARVLLLDDGFQHRKLYRDLDIVLWDAASAASQGRVLPTGCLREPIAALERADVIIRIDRGDGPPPPPPIEVDAVMNARLIPVARQSLTEGTRVHALSGIADPGSFERSLTTLGLELTGATRFPDHHPFRRDEIREAAERAGQEDADCLAVTAKDWARWPAGGKELPVPAVFDLDVEVELGDALVGRVAGLAQGRTP
jgi:tetraacyldisaccharide 4'-kinase